MDSDSPIGKHEIAEGLKALGLPRGGILMVHASLSSLGRVEGGAEAVIDALLEALGPEGTLLMPTHPARDGRTFDPEAIPSDMGLITETFRLRPGVLRSRHPYHPVAAFGARAEEVLRDHERSAVPDGPDTPYGRLIALEGRVLHIGCDLDTLTLLHTVEAELDLPYLRELEMDYVDARGSVRTLQIERCPGGHRGGVLKFDRLFHEEGAMGVGRIGRAVCRLISAQRAAAIMRREMARDPAFALDDNLHCADCVRFRGKIKAAHLTEEDFCVSAPLRRSEGDLGRALDRIQGEGISCVEVQMEGLETSGEALDGLREPLAERGMEIVALRTEWRSEEEMVGLCESAARVGAGYLRIAAPTAEGISRSQLTDAIRSLVRQADGMEVTLLLGNRAESLVATAEELAGLVGAVGSPRLRASYAPAEIVRSGGSPFYGGLYRGPLRRFVDHVDLQDVVAVDGRTVRAGWGNAEIREIVSNLRCRSFEGIFCVWPVAGEGAEGYREAGEGVWEVLEGI